MPDTQRTPARAHKNDSVSQQTSHVDVDIEPATAERLRNLIEEASSGLSSIAMDVPLTVIATKLLRDFVRKLPPELQNELISPVLPRSYRHSLTNTAENMERGIAALGPALAEIETPVSPQLARSVAATENVWRELEDEFGLFSSLEVSQLVGSKSPNRSYASEQRSRDRLIAVKRPGGLRYPGFQIDQAEHVIRPVMTDLIRIASAAGRSEASLALWMTTRTGYLDGERPVDQLSQPDKVLEAAQQSFNIQW